MVGDDPTVEARTDPCQVRGHLDARPITLTTPQASLHAADRIVASLAVLLTLDSDAGHFLADATSLLPWLLAATRTTGLPAGGGELTNSKVHCYVTASPPALLGARKTGLTS